MELGDPGTGGYRGDAADPCRSHGAARAVEQNCLLSAFFAKLLQWRCDRLVIRASSRHGRCSAAYSSSLPGVSMPPDCLWPLGLPTQGEALLSTDSQNRLPLVETRPPQHHRSAEGARFADWLAWSASDLRPEMPRTPLGVPYEIHTFSWSAISTLDHALSASRPATLRETPADVDPQKSWTLERGLGVLQEM